MTFTPPIAPARRRDGFTLIEILVVIGIIVILAGVLVPMIGRSMRQAKRTRTAADMQAIATALEAFKADHGDYPRVGYPNAGAGTLGRFLFGVYGDSAPMGSPQDDPPAYSSSTEYLPGDAVRDGAAITDLTWVCVRPTTGNPPPSSRTATPSPFWAFVGVTDPTGGMDGVNDGADGPGIKMRGGGKKWGPYLQQGKFNLRGCAVLDVFDRPILYFPATAGNPNVTLRGGYLPLIAASNPPNDDLAQYDVSDNWSPFQHANDSGIGPAQQRVHAMLGDLIMSPAAQEGAINTASGEPAAQTAPFILWSAGPDGLFGPFEITLGDTPANLALNRQSVEQCDDVTNFR